MSTKKEEVKLVETPFGYSVIVGAIPRGVGSSKARVRKEDTREAKLERLAILVEECAEVQQVVGKILRHGEGSYHPDNSRESNIDLLEKEILDLITALTMLVQNGDININRIYHRFDDDYIARKNKYLHFNKLKGYL